MSARSLSILAIILAGISIGFNLGRRVKPSRGEVAWDHGRIGGFQQSTNVARAVAVPMDVEIGLGADGSVVWRKSP